MTNIYQNQKRFPILIIFSIKKLIRLTTNHNFWHIVPLFSFNHGTIWIKINYCDKELKNRTLNAAHLPTRCQTLWTFSRYCLFGRYAPCNQSFMHISGCKSWKIAFSAWNTSWIKWHMRGCSYRNLRANLEGLRNREVYKSGLKSTGNG